MDKNIPSRKLLISVFWALCFCDDSVGDQSGSRTLRRMVAQDQVVAGALPRSKLPSSSSSLQVAKLPRCQSPTNHPTKPGGYAGGYGGGPGGILGVVGKGGFGLAPNTSISASNVHMLRLPL